MTKSNIEFADKNAQEPPAITKVDTAPKAPSADELAKSFVNVMSKKAAIKEYKLEDIQH